MLKFTMSARRFILCLTIFGFLFIRSSKAQLTFHTDANSNSFTLKAPGVQQSFTRYFGGGKRGNLVQAVSAMPFAQRTQTSLGALAHAQQQPQQQQLLQPQRFQYSGSGVGFPPQGLRQQSYQQYETVPSAYQQPEQQEVIYQSAAAAGPSYASSRPLSYQDQQFLYSQAVPQPANFRSYAAQASQSVPSIQQQLQAHLQQAQTPMQSPYSQSVPLTAAAADQLQAAYGYRQQGGQIPAQSQVGYQAGFDQARLLLDLYRNQPSAQGQPLSQPYAEQGSQMLTPEQHFNFLNQQHYDVMKAQQSQLDSAGNYFSEIPISTTISPPASVPTSTPASGLGTRYSPSTGVSNVNFSSGNLNYKF